MSAVAWTHWDEAFLAADKEPEKRLTFTLTPAFYERALVSLAVDHGWLQKDDPRYQEACRLGVLEWWDGRGRCVAIIREGSGIGQSIPAPLPPADPYVGVPLVPDPVVQGAFIPKPLADALMEKARRDDSPSVLIGPPPPAPGIELGPPRITALEPIKGKGKKK